MLKRDFRAKLANVFERLQYRLLCHVFGIRFVSKNREGGSIHAAFVGTNQLIKEIVLTSQTRRISVSSLTNSAERSAGCSSDITLSGIAPHRTETQR